MFILKQIEIVQILAFKSPSEATNLRQIKILAVY